MQRANAIAAVVIAAALAAPSLRAQSKADPNPKLGMQPVGAYALSNIETINQTSGNMMFNIPIGSLGPDRVGNSFGVSLGYNSKFWEPWINQQTVTIQGVPTTVWVSELNVESHSSAGWKYTAGYDLEITQRQGVDLSVFNGNCQNIPTDPSYYYLTMVRVVFPDGSKHLLRLKNDLDNAGDGYYRYTPYGAWWPGCGNPVYWNGAMQYYTTDGTFVQAVIQYNSTHDKISWALYFRDGGYVLGGNNPSNFQPRSQQVCDRNSNCVSIQNATYSETRRPPYPTSTAGRSRFSTAHSRDLSIPLRPQALGHRACNGASHGRPSPATNTRAPRRTVAGAELAPEALGMQ